MAKGDHISVRRGLYSHHGIDLGNGQVIHYSGEKGNDAVVRVDSIQRFADGGEIRFGKSEAKYSRDEIVRRARSRVGEISSSTTANSL